jgi:hypothetical protein
MANSIVNLNLGQIALLRVRPSSLNDNVWCLEAVVNFDVPINMFVWTKSLMSAVCLLSKFGWWIVEMGSSMSDLGLLFIHLISYEKPWQFVCCCTHFNLYVFLDNHLYETCSHQSNEIMSMWRCHLSGMCWGVCHCHERQADEGFLRIKKTSPFI